MRRLVVNCIHCPLRCQRHNAGDAPAFRLTQSNRTDATAARPPGRCTNICDRRFHRALIPESGREFARTLATYFDRAERFRRMFQSEEIQGGVRLQEEHEAILRACKKKDASKAAALVARHSARAALTLMAQIAPDREPTLVRTALQLFAALEGS